MLHYDTVLGEGKASRLIPLPYNIEVKNSSPQFFRQKNERSLK
jgi:hypothetical protein